MHSFEMPKEYVERVTARQGRPHTCETFDTQKTALVVVDMQHFFMVEPYMMACPVAQDIVPNVNRLARAVRKTGGKVVWIQNLAPWQSLESWSALHERFAGESRDLRIRQMQKDHHGFQLWPGLEVEPEDERVIKRRYSAFIHGSSNIENVLKDNGIETIIVAGVATNVCCESTARDAMMLNYRTMMVADGCAAASDELHAGSLGNFYLQFGDVQATDEIIARLEASARRNA
jgi:ureidoacrylate peracid hydrolase